MRIAITLGPLRYSKYYGLSSYDNSVILIQEVLDRTSKSFCRPEAMSALRAHNVGIQNEWNLKSFPFQIHAKQIPLNLAGFDGVVQSADLSEAC